MSEYRVCTNCGTELTRKPGEKPGQFRARRSCNHQCAMLSNWQTRKEQLPAKTCVICGSSFTRNNSERFKRYNERQACSFSCKQTLVIRNREAKRELPEKWCVVCGVRMDKSSTEHFSQFVKRATCGRECHCELLSIQKTRYNADIRATPYPPEFTEALKIRIRDRDGHACQWCGEPELTRTHHVHHIDYRKENCDEDNLITLCDSCHPQTTFGDRAEWARRLRAIQLERQIAA
jgi:5-methylcytosine-specific restriction endonuclease McrA